MATLEVKSFDTPDETRSLDHAVADFVTMGEHTVGRGVAQPGWKWSKHLKPLVGTESCQHSHLTYIISGRMRAIMDDGTEAIAGPGEIAVIPPGHDAEVVGDEPCEFIDFVGLGGFRSAG